MSEIQYSGPHGLQFDEWYSYHAAGAVTGKRLRVSGTPLGTNTASLDAGYTYDNQGKVSAVQYPLSQWSNGNVTSNGPQYGYEYDSMNRLNVMTGPTARLVNGVTYGPAGELLQLNANAFTETRTYNANLQLTELVSGTSVHFKYGYSATQNNGKILSMQDAISGETIAYQYDSLQRLTTTSATGDPSGSWSQSFTYDGFGSLVQKNGSNAATNLFLGTNPLTNRLNMNGAQYDNNGNLTAYGTGVSAAAYTYDLENRVELGQPSRIRRCAIRLRLFQPACLSGNLQFWNVHLLQ